MLQKYDTMVSYYSLLIYTQTMKRFEWPYDTPPPPPPPPPLSETVNCLFLPEIQKYHASLFENSVSY